MSSASVSINFGNRPIFLVSIKETAKRTTVTVQVHGDTEKFRAYYNHNDDCYCPKNMRREAIARAAEKAHGRATLVGIFERARELKNFLVTARTLSDLADYGYTVERIA